MYIVTQKIWDNFVLCDHQIKKWFSEKKRILAPMVPKERRKESRIDGLIA